MMAAAQALMPGYADAKAATMWSAQLTDAPAPDKAGNLFAPVPGLVGIDGRFKDRTKRTRKAYWTSRDRDLLVAGLTGVVALGLFGVAALARAPRRLLPRL
jgi:hypothetical protein